MIFPALGPLRPGAGRCPETPRSRPYSRCPHPWPPFRSSRCWPVPDRVGAPGQEGIIDLARQVKNRIAHHHAPFVAGGVGKLVAAVHVTGARKYVSGWCAAVRPPACPLRSKCHADPHPAPGLPGCGTAHGHQRRCRRSGSLTASSLKTAGNTFLTTGLPMHDRRWPPGKRRPLRTGMTAITASAMSGSSLPRIWPARSTTVTGVPRRLKAWAISMPMGPAPRTIMLSGSRFSEKISLLVM